MDTTGTPHEGSVAGRRRLVRLSLALIVAAVTCAWTAIPTFAYGTPLACGARSESAAFKPFGDTNTYFRVSNGGFESGAADWLLKGGASVVGGQETWKVGGSADAKALSLPAGATAETRTFCISKGEDKVRFFIKNPGVAGAFVKVDILVTNPTNGWVSTVSQDFHSEAIASGWSVSPVILISDLFGGGGTETVSITFTNKGASGTFQIDDLYVDPFKST
jgi:hypothetical protein